MTTAEIAEHVMVCEKTIRRYIRAGLLRPRQDRMGGSFRYVFSGEDIERALIARDQKKKKLEAFSPALARHLGNSGKTTAISFSEMPEPALAQCSRCGHSLR